MDDRMGVYISHSAEDSAFSIQLAWALRGAGMDAWCDVHVSDKHMPGPALREVSARPIFILVLSPAALTSTWVQAEYRTARESYNRGVEEWAAQVQRLRMQRHSDMAYVLELRGVRRVILPVVIAPLDAERLSDEWRLLTGYNIVARDAGLAPLSHWDTIEKTLTLLLSRFAPTGDDIWPGLPNADMFYTPAKLLRERAEGLLRSDENAVELLIERGRAYSPPGDGEIPTGPYAIWCVVANVRKDVPFGADARETREGTKHFPPGAKVYCFPPLWGDGYDAIKVIGHHCESGRFATLVMRSNRLTNWRAYLAYGPHVIKEMAEYWDGTAASRAQAEDIAQMCRDRERSWAGHVGPEQESN